MVDQVESIVIIVIKIKYKLLNKNWYQLISNKVNLV